ncbi:hypothetical protein GQ457_10G012400 [Hibiscus cannabinus]
MCHLLINDIFKFEAAWLSEETCAGEVSHLWNQAVGSVPLKLKHVCAGLENWFANIRASKKLTSDDLNQRLHDLYNAFPSDDVLGDIVEVKFDLNIEAEKEEIYWEQRARANWLKEDDVGIVHSDIDKLLGIANDYFSSLFTPVTPTSFEHILQGVSPYVNDSMNEILLRSYTYEEFLSALKSMSPLKASGEDGLGVVFYQRFWHVFGKEILQKSTKKKGIHWCNCSKPLKDTGGMGFRDMSKFNIAMLAKQGWRIIENLDSLVARLFKAKYYRSSNFLEDPLEFNPSLVWRSIWCAKGLLQSGLKWRIGSGFNVSIWSDYWLPTPIQPLISSPQINGLNLVSDLIDPEARIGYRHLLGSGDANATEVSLNKALWSLKCPSKIHILVWRCMHNYVHTFHKLCIKRVMTGSSCPRSKTLVEDIVHIIRDNPFLTQLWSSLNIQQPWTTSNLRKIWDLTRVILESDSNSIIKKLKSVKDDSSILRSIIWDILCLSNSFLECHFRFTPRDCNRCAPEIARACFSSSIDCFWVEEVPHFFQALVDLDRRFFVPP